MASIRFDSGPRTGERVPLDKNKITFGRAKTSDCIIAHPTVSREHFIVERNNGKLFLVDRGSENGTSANGERVSWIELKDGDKIQAGPFTLVFEASDESASLAEAPPQSARSSAEETSAERTAFDTTQSGIHPGHYLQGIEHFNAGRYFDAHEVWEEIWLRSSGDTKLFYQMLIQAAVGLHHYERGNARGARGMHANVVDKLDRLPSFVMSLDLNDFSCQFRGFFAELIENNDEAPPLPTGRGRVFGFFPGTPPTGAFESRMIEQQALARSITAIVGSDHLSEEPELKIDDLSPRLLARPGSGDEVAGCMKVCSELNAAVVPAGRMTWLEYGNPLKRADLVLSLERMRRIIDYSPPDLTATVEAGLTLSEFNAVTARERQWLPLDPPGFKCASLGAIASCNSSGALRLGFGAPRDYVIGLKLVHADGAQSKAGGKVVKNVAGYDMNKLYVGSHGTLAIITEITFKLRPQPERSATMLIASKYRGSLFQLANRVLASELQPASAVLTHRLSASGVSNQSDDALLIRFIDSEPGVEHQTEWVKKAIDENYNATVLNEKDAGAVWTEVADFNRRAIRVRLSVPLSAVPAEFEKAFLGHLECVAAADIGAGIIRLAFDADDGSAADQIKRLRASATGAGGALIIERAPSNIRGKADAWGDVGSTASLMRSIKDRFDPHSLLNPGKFVLGL